MVFTGSKESCPNYDTDTTELNMSYDTFTSTFAGARSNTLDPSFGRADFNKKCFNICPTKNDDLSAKGPTYIDNGSCRECLDEEGSLNNPAQGTRRNLRNSGKYEMCNAPDQEGSGASVDSSSRSRIWFMRQQDANLSGLAVGGINWSLANNMNSGEGRRILNYWSEAQRGMTNQEILRLIGNRTSGSMNYTLPEKYMKREYIGTVTQNDDLGVEVFDFEKVRNDINRGRGSVVNCPTGTDRPAWVACPSGKFGPNDIIPEEVEDFIVELLDNERSDPTNITNLSSFNSLLSGLQYDSTFEACVNDKLNTGVDDLDAQERVSKYTSIKEFKSADINYLKKKLR